MNKYFLILAVTLFVQSINAQERYWVFFTDKKNTTFDPYKYFDCKAIERRIMQDLPVCDSTDFPINEDYKNALSDLNVEITTESRWFNCVAANLDSKQIETIKQLSFVKEILPEIIQTYPAGSGKINSYDPKLLINQTKRMQGNLFNDAGINGKGIRIAIFDGGFPNVDNDIAFEEIRKENRIIKTWDFAKNKEFVYGYIPHGTMVMSCIAGKLNGENIGIAIGAEFLLARTEVNSEPFYEEENWLAAVEWADKNGADIINSSLGYTIQRYFPWDMDGKTSLVARAATLAAKKGILVVNAQGNDGSDKWKYLGTPADADSVLSVGGINPSTDYHISFSSFGPTADKRRKPNVCAYGHVVAIGKSGPKEADGTSFSSPLVAGFAACAWQTNHNLTNMELFSEIEKSGDLYPYFDYAHGFGVPQASYFTEKNNIIKTKTFNVIETNDSIRISVVDTLIDFKTEFGNNYLYYHIRTPKGQIEKYAVINVYTPDVLAVDKRKYIGNILMIHYKGYSEIIEIK